MDILDIDEVLKDDPFICWDEKSHDDVFNIIQQWKSSNCPLSSQAQQEQENMELIENMENPNETFHTTRGVNEQRLRQSTADIQTQNVFDLAYAEKEELENYYDQDFADMMKKIYSNSDYLKVKDSIETIKQSKISTDKPQYLKDSAGTGKEQTFEASDIAMKNHLSRKSKLLPNLATNSGISSTTFIVSKLPLPRPLSSGIKISTKQSSDAITTATKPECTDKDSFKMPSAVYGTQAPRTKRGGLVRSSGTRFKQEETPQQLLFSKDLDYAPTPPPLMLPSLQQTSPNLNLPLKLEPILKSAEEADTDYANNVHGDTQASGGDVEIGEYTELKTFDENDNDPDHVNADVPIEPSMEQEPDQENEAVTSYLEA